METTRIIWSWRRSLQHFFRARQIRYENAQIIAQNNASILLLPDDILLLILDLVHLDGVRSSKVPDRDVRISTYKCFLNLSMTNTRLRALAAHKLFRTITMGMSWSPERVHAAVASIRSCEAVVKHNRELKLDLWLDTAAPAVKRQKHVGLEVLSLIRNMPRLQKLSIAMQETNAGHFRAVCDDSNCVFPQVTELVLSPSMGWMIARCPGVKKISSNDWNFADASQLDTFVDLAGECSQLENFNIQCYWSVELLKKIHQLMPQLRSLGMRGRNPKHDLRQLIPILSRFRSLRTLHLESARDLGRALQSGCHPSLYLSYFHCRMGPEAISPAEETITKMIFKNLHSLRELSLGPGFTAEVVTGSGRQVNIRWELSVRLCDIRRRHGLCHAKPETCQGYVEDVREVPYFGEHPNDSGSAHEQEWIREMNAIEHLTDPRGF